MNTEGINVNVNVVDVGRMELLINKGLYSDTEDFINKAIIHELANHEDVIVNVIKELDSDLHFHFGNVVLNSEKLANMKFGNKKKKLYVIGRLTIEEDVSLQLIKDTIESIKVFGPCIASPNIKELYLI
jgi:hypothetical protein